MKKLLIIFVSSLIVLSLTAPLAYTTNARAQDKKSVTAACEGANAITGGGNCNTSGGSIPGLLSRVVNILSWIVGIAAVIMIILGGFWVITAAGDPTKIGRARSTILYAIIGLVIVALAQVLVKFVIKKVI